MVYLRSFSAYRSQWPQDPICLFSYQQNFKALTQHTSLTYLITQNAVLFAIPLTIFLQN